MLLPKARREALTRRSCHVAAVVLLKPLKSLMGQNVKSPFSNIHAGTFKLHLCSSRIVDANRRKFDLGTKSP
jgi:hypothetical protein